MAAKKKQILDIFRVLSAMNRRDFSFYQTLNDEEKKDFKDKGIVTLRWMSTLKLNKRNSIAEIECQLLQLNHVANMHFWNSDITDHPELQYLMLTCSGLDEIVEHDWIKGPAKKSKNKVMILLSQVYPIANEKELKLFFDINNKEEIIEIANMMGYSNDQIKELKKELKKQGK